jgi:hypothetical protein
MLRLWLRGGLDRDLASAMFWSGRLRSLSMGIRHIQAGQPSFWWVSAVSEKGIRGGIGLPTMPVRGHTTFSSPTEVDDVWSWVRKTTSERNLQPPNLDEQWWGGNASTLEANLAEARRVLPGRLLSIKGSAWEDDRTFSSGYSVRAEFIGREGADRPAMASIFDCPIDANIIERISQWAEALKQREPITVVVERAR